MEAKKKSPPTPASAGAAPLAANGYFSSVFSASPAANARDARQTDLYTILNKQNPKGQNGGGIADGKSQGSPTKGHTAYKDGKHFYPNESSESPYFGSSVHYSGRDFYDSSPHKQANESSRNYKESNPDDSLATRGDWWQGIKGAGLLQSLTRAIRHKKSVKLHPFCRWRQYLDASSHLGRCSLMSFLFSSLPSVPDLGEEKL